MSESPNEAVEMLGITQFIDANLDRLLERLKEAHTHALRTANNMVFVTTSLPIVNGLIHFASRRAKLNQALAWVAQEWRDTDIGDNADPISTLAALTLIYTIDRGIEKTEASSEDHKIWMRMRERVVKLRQDLEAAKNDSE